MTIRVDNHRMHMDRTPAPTKRPGVAGTGLKGPASEGPRVEGKATGISGQDFGIFLRDAAIAKLAGPPPTGAARPSGAATMGQVGQARGGFPSGISGQDLGILARGPVDGSPATVTTRTSAGDTSAKTSSDKPSADKATVDRIDGGRSPAARGGFPSAVEVQLVGAGASGYRLAAPLPDPQAGDAPTAPTGAAPAPAMPGKGIAANGNELPPPPRAIAGFQGGGGHGAEGAALHQGHGSPIQNRPDMAQAAAKGGALDPWRDGIPVNAQILSHSVHARPGAHPAASAYPEQAERTYGMHASLGKGIGAHRAVGHDERPFDSKEAFVQTLRPHAQRAGRELGVDPDLLLAQAALETNWGRQMRTDSNVGNSHNLFGMKAKSHWKGDTVRVLTTEYRGRHIQQEFHHFRAYGSYEESFRDYVSHLQANADRYGRALARAAHPRDFIQGLQRGGYATDPRYADKVMRVFQDELLSGAGKSVASR